MVVVAGHMTFNVYSWVLIHVRLFGHRILNVYSWVLMALVLAVKMKIVRISGIRLVIMISPHRFATQARLEN